MEEQFTREKYRKELSVSQRIVIEASHDWSVRKSMANANREKKSLMILEEKLDYIKNLKKELKKLYQNLEYELTILLEFEKNYAKNISQLKEYLAEIDSGLNSIKGKESRLHVISAMHKKIQISTQFDNWDFYRKLFPNIFMQTLEENSKKEVYHELEKLLKSDPDWKSNLEESLFAQQKLSKYLNQNLDLYYKLIVAEREFVSTLINNLYSTIPAKQDSIVNLREKIKQIEIKLK